jgi:NADP-dependent 3-hydroxy acid dehydrogenase YdfG
MSLAAAAALPEGGAEVTMAARWRDELEARAAEIRRERGTVVILALDVADLDAVERELRRR